MVETSRNALSALRETHEDRVLGLLRTHGALSRADLARRTGLSRATLSTIVNRLISIDAVTASAGEDSPARGRGRPPTLLTLNPAGGLALGIDLGHRRIHASIANVAHDVIATASMGCDEDAPWHQRVEEALAMVDTMCARQHISLAALDGVGVGVVGPVAETGVVPAGPDADSAAVVHRLVTEHLGVPAQVDNNTRLAALAETIWGAGTGSQNVLYVHLSYGVGGGLVLGGHLFSGAFGAAAEIGHVSVDPGGPACACGGRGCLERSVSIDAIIARCRARDLDDVLARMHQNDHHVHDVIRDAGRQLGGVVAAACNIVNPEAVVVGGELSAAGDPLLEPVREALATYTHQRVHQNLAVRPATLADGGAALGGIALILRRSTLLAGYPALQEPRNHLEHGPQTETEGGVVEHG